MFLIDREKSMFIEGAWSHASGGAILEVINPSNQERITTIAGGNAADVQRAVGAACQIFPSWKNTPSAVRANYLRGIAAGLEKRQGVLVDLQMLNNGKPRLEAEIDVSDAIATFLYYATLAENLDARQDTRVEHTGNEHFGLVRHEPIGPVGLIVPWNFPLVTSAWKIAPALAAGCTAVMKTSEITPLIELVYGDIAQEIGLPSGVLNIVTGGADVGIALTAAPGLRKISFTGSNMIGAKVMEAVSSRCLPVALELGGKSPIVVLADADLDHAADCIVGGIFFNNGQICSATSRLIVDQEIEPALIDILVERANNLVVGAPCENSTDIGPITTRAQYTKVCEYLDHAIESGLDCVAGGTTIDIDGGNFLRPTIYRNVPHNHRIWLEEVFGPVLSTSTFSSVEEAITLANNSEYGLVGSVVSTDWERAKNVADQIEAGQIWINTPQIVYPNSAWGGFKSSGIGRELGPWGLSGFQGVKHILSPNM